MMVEQELELQEAEAVAQEPLVLLETIMYQVLVELV
jgi:hypothetical protein